VQALLHRLLTRSDFPGEIAATSRAICASAKSIATHKKDKYKRETTKYREAICMHANPTPGSKRGGHNFVVERKVKMRNRTEKKKKYA
jgi:hypothetical protein